MSKIVMSCPRCKSARVVKNGFNRGQQRYKCKDCNRHFQEKIERHQAKTNHRQLPEKALILLTSHRSGSTWLSDAIRCHPAIEYYPTSVVYEKLGLYGRRYPGDLSNQADCSYEIEVQPKKIDLIPKFDPTPDLDSTLKRLKFSPYAVEKCHPSFFDFKPELFIQKVNRLESLGIEVKLVYLVRDPQSLMTSFMDYQRRKPTWYKEIVAEKLINFISNTYKCINEVSQIRDGLILDYSDTRVNMPKALLKIYKMLWSNPTKQQEKYLKEIARLAPKYTSREQRVAKTNSPFLGEKEGNIQGGDSKYQHFFKSHEKMINHCYACYEMVV